MAVRTDLTIDYSLSPRVVTVAAPSTVLTIQDLYDTLATDQATVGNMSRLILVKAAGKDDLGGGVKVGVTCTLQNTRLAFAARAGPSTVQCKVSGGNLVAVDAAGAALDPIMPTAFTQVVLAQSASPTLLTAGSAVTAQDKVDISDQVWDKAKAGHTGANTFGAALDAVKTRVDALPTPFLLNTARPGFHFVMIAASDHITPLAGLTVTGERNLDDTWTPLDNPVSGIGNGVYKVDLSATDLSALVVTLRFTAVGADPRYITITM